MLQISPVVVSNVSVTLLSFAYETQKSNFMFKCFLNFRMILQRSYFGPQDTPVLLKELLKSTILLFFHVITLSFMYVLFNYTILLYFYNICYQSRTFFFVIQSRTFCYQSRTLLSVALLFVINTR